MTDELATTIEGSPVSTKNLYFSQKKVRKTVPFCVYYIVTVKSFRVHRCRLILICEGSWGLAPNGAGKE
jgi:hypothetical protein